MVKKFEYNIKFILVNFETQEVDEIDTFKVQLF